MNSGEGLEKQEHPYIFGRPKVAQQVWVRLLLGPRAPDSQASDLAPQKMLASWLVPPLPQLLLTPALLGKVALDT